MGIMEELRDEVVTEQPANATTGPAPEEQAVATGAEEASAPTQETGASGGDSGADSSAQGLLAAKMAETKRRQEAEERTERVEKELAELRGRLEVIQSLHAPPKSGPTEPEEDPAQLDAEFLTRPAETSLRLARREAERMMRDVFVQRLTYDMEDLKSEGVNVEEVDKVFETLAKQDPVLLKRFRLSERPGRFAADAVARHRKKLEEQTSGAARLSQYEAKIKELESQLAQGRGATAQITESNAVARSAGRAPSSRARDSDLDEVEIAQQRWRKRR